MDYSSLPSDPDHPAGASPWASSPQHNRTTFAAEVPPSPLPAAQSPYSTGPDHHDQLDDSRDQHGSSEGFGGTENSHDGGVAPAQADTQPEQPQQQQSYGQGHQAHEQQDQQQRPRPPQCKLQAKITGLERTGRKDPILRFDVYVCLSSTLPRSSSTNQARQIFPNSEPLNSATYAVRTLNSRSSKTISSQRIPRHLFPLYLQQSQQQELVPTKTNSVSRHLCSGGSMSYAPTMFSFVTRK